MPEIGAFFIKLALGGMDIGRAVFGAARKFLAALNPQGRAGLIAALALSVLWLHTAGEARHWKKQSDRYERLYNRELDHEKRIAAQATALKTKIDALTANISATVKEWKDEQNSLVAAAAANLRLRGPGKATCSGSASASGSAGGSQHTGQPGDAAIPEVPDGAGVVLIGMPFDDAVTWGADHDALRIEVLAWRDWYQRLVAAWPKS